MGDVVGGRIVGVPPGTMDQNPRLETLQPLNQTTADPAQADDYI